MNQGERLAMVEVDIKHIKKMVNAILIIVIGKFGFDFIPLAWLTLLG